VVALPDWFSTFPKQIQINIKEPIDNAIDYMVDNWGVFFDAVKAFFRVALNGVGWLVNRIPWWLLIVLVFAATLKISKKPGRAAAYSLMLFFVGAMGYWSLMNVTLTLIITAVLLSLIVGLPLGILMASGERLNKIMRPILDTMQTMPSFVYMIPFVLLLQEIGKIPAVIATMVYAIPPAVRLTNLGIRQVDSEVVEAAKAFGATRKQTLLKVQIPQAMPTIMAGINQTIMMAIAMAVTSAMIGAGGLGSEVLIGINRLESGRGFAAGISIVILAIIMDRLTQGLVKSKNGEIDSK